MNKLFYLGAYIVFVIITLIFFINKLIQRKPLKKERIDLEHYQQDFQSKNKFKNTILIIVFNYFQDFKNNKEYLKKIYSPVFKKIVFYTDGTNTDRTEDEDENYCDISRGCYVHRLFPYFFQKYKCVLDNCDGLFYTMDDNFLNINLIENLDNNKIFFEKHVDVKDLDCYNGWHWDNSIWGKNAILKLLEDNDFKKYNISQFTNCFADFFYLPRRYLTQRLFNLFEFFGKHNVFLEIAIPSIIHNIEPDVKQYNRDNISMSILWDEDRRKTEDKSWVYEKMKTDMVIHPLKLSGFPIIKEWINDIFFPDAKLQREDFQRSSKNAKCIVITTINKPSKQLISYSTLKNWDLIVVGDSKTDDNSFYNIKCTYLGLKEQKQLFPTLFDKVPLKSYTRKMFGYLFAIKHKYSCIYDTDDDNIYTGDLNKFEESNRSIKMSSNNGFVNLYRIYTNRNIWPRGIPPLHPVVTRTPCLEDCTTNMQVAIIQGLVNNDPDVDAYYRINVNNKSFTFEKEQNFDVILDKYSVCPFNSQNTFWCDSSMFYAMYLPVTVTFRYTDILRGFVALYQLWRSNRTIKFTYPTAVQERNDHDLMKDFESEIPMYETAEKVIDLLNNNKNASIVQVYDILAANNIVSKTEVEVLQEWLNLLNSS